MDTDTGFRKATPEDHEALLTLMARMQELFGPQMLTGKPLFDHQQKVYQGMLTENEWVAPLAPKATMLHGLIEKPTHEKRLLDKTLVRLKNYWVHVSAYKVDSMPRVAYVIKFRRNVDRRLYRRKTWEENCEGSKIYVHGYTANEVWDKFLTAFASPTLGAEDLGATPQELITAYWFQTQPETV